MKIVLESDTVKWLETPDKQHLCLFDLVNERVLLFKKNGEDLILLRKLYGEGVFLNNEILLLFYNNLGYGYLEGDSYLYNIKTDNIIPLYSSSFEEIISTNHCNGGYFISFSSNIIVTDNYLIMKDEFGGIYFYHKFNIIKNKELKYNHYISDKNAQVRKIYDFDEKKNLLKFCTDVGSVEELNVDFSKSTSFPNSSISLSNNSPFFQGFSLDYHTISSKLNPDGSFETQRSAIGEELFQLKYRNKKSSIGYLAKIAAEFITHEFHNIDVLIPIPASNEHRAYQPVNEIAKSISNLLKIPYDGQYLRKQKITPEIKSIDDYNVRIEILQNTFSVLSNKHKEKNILLFDDIYRSGATLTAAAKLLKKEGNVQNVYVLTLTKTRTKQ